MRKNEPNTSEPGQSVSGIDLTGGPSCETSPNSTASNLHDIEKGELQESPQSHCAFEQPMFLGQVPVLGTPANLHEHLGSLKDKLLKKRIDLINKVCSRREEDLSLKQQQEITDFNMHKEKLELNLKKAHEKDLELINDLVMNSADKNDKIRLLKEEFLKKMTGLEKQMDCQYKKLKDMQLFARDKEQQIKNHWLEEAKAGKLTESFDRIPLSDSGFRLEELKLANQDEAHDGLRNRIYDSRESGPFQNKQTGELITVADLVTNGLNLKTSEGPTVFPPEGSGCLPNQIDSLVSQSNVTYVTETESEPRETPLEVPSSLPPSTTVDLTMGTESESLPSEAPVMNSVIIEAESLPSESRESGPLQNKQTGELITVADLVTNGLNCKTSDGLTFFPPEGSGCLPNQIDSLVSQSNVMYVTETESEPRETPLEVPSTLPPSKTVDLTIGTEYLPSEAPVMNSLITEAESGPLQNKQTGELIIVADLVTSGLNSKTSEELTVFPPEGSGCLPNQINSLVSQSNVMYVTKTESDPRETPLEVPSTLPPSKTVDLTIGTESLPSEAPVMNSVIIEADDIPINSSTPATVETEKQRGAENSDILCSSFCPLGSIEEGRSMNDGEDASLNTALLQNQANCHTDFQNDVSPCQAPHFSRHERIENSAVIEVQGSGSLQETPNLADFGTVGLTNHNMTVSNSSHGPLPVCTVVPLVSHVQESIAASGTEEELSDQIQHLSHQNDMPMQEPIVLSSELVGQANPHPLVSQFVDHSFLPNSDTRSQRSISEDLRSTSQPESVHYPLFPLAQLMPTQGIQPEPLKNELTSIRMHQDKITKMHDDRKLHLKYECDQELEKVRRKYDMLLQDAESEFLRSKEVLETIYNKVSMNQVLAEEFRAKFIENKGGTSSSRGHQTLQQLLQSSQPQFIQRSVSSSTSTPMPLPATLPPAAAPSSLASVRLQTPMIPSSQTPGSSVRLQTPLIPYGQAPSSLASVRLQAPPLPYGQVPSSLASVRLQAPLIPSGQAARWTSSVHPSNSARAHLCPMVPPQPNVQIRSETRAPAPHLQRFRGNTSMTSHQQPHADVLSATMGQVVPMPTAQPCTDPHFGQSHISNTVSVCQDASPFYSELPMGVGNTIGGVNRSISQFTDLVPSFDSWLATKPTSTAPAFSQPCVEPCGVVDMPPSNSDVVCISDDD
uniref:Zonadhesin-related protein n=1 Tax=Musa balbisiana TaxID=52838 RepID=B5RHU5_MUSBA|nr:zonadhesin-related protein [Musa balbisiana]